MCGIFGFTGFNDELLGDARKSLHVLNHRGPDQWGEYYDEYIYMGHQRLSILDLSEHGKQPMMNLDKSVVITVNGEIYNYLELKNELMLKYEFKSTSDSEVILYGFLEWGIDELLEKIDGMYALSIYNKKEDELYLVRDRFGKKPLFYTQKKNKFFYSSEVKSFFEFDDDFRVFSYEGIKDWIYHRGSHSKKTIFDGIFSLSPGRYLRIKDGLIKEKKYYDILDTASVETCDVEPGYLKKKLVNAIEKRLLSDVPVGLQLSGGVDSSIVGHHIKKELTGDVHSFSIGFKEKKYKKFSEESYATYVAKKEGLVHHQINIKKEDVVNEFEQTIWLFDGMLAYPNAIPMYLLNKHAKKFVTVILTGEGADELFGGYTKLKNMEGLERKDYVRDMPDFIIQNVIGMFLKTKARELYLKKKYSGNTRSILENINCYISPPTFEKIFGVNKCSLFDDIDYGKLKVLPFYKQLLIMDHKTYLPSLLDRQDRTSMGAGIESRLPFLDKKLVEWAINLDKTYLFDDSENKKILKKYCAEIYGDQFTYRKKMGFPLPIKDWLNDEAGFKVYLDKIFDEDFILRDKIDMNFLKKYFKTNSFDSKNLNYSDSERIWIKWFLMVIRTTQDVFKIKEIK